MGKTTEWSVKAAIIALVFATGPALAHGSKGTHGGTVVDFGKFHLEGVLEGDEAHFYLIDEANKPAAVAKHEGGSVTVVTSGGNITKTEILPASPFGDLKVPISGKGKVTASIKLKVSGKTETAKFKFDRK